MIKFATTTNGISHEHTLNVDMRDEILESLPRMDGKKFFAYSVWSFPDDKDFDDVDIEEASSYFLQCAGSANAMTVELRERGDDGDRHYVLAKAPITGRKSVTIPYEENVVTVHPEEVLNASEAAEIFRSYMDTGGIPKRWHRREIQ